MLVRSAWACMAYGAASAVAALAAGCLAVGNLWPDGPWLLVAALAAVVAGAGMAWRLQMVISRDGLVVKNPLRTHRLAPGERSWLSRRRARPSQVAANPGHACVCCALAEQLSSSWQRSDCASAT